MVPMLHVSPVIATRTTGEVVSIKDAIIQFFEPTFTKIQKTYRVNLKT